VKKVHSALARPCNKEKAFIEQKHNPVTKIIALKRGIFVGWCWIGLCDRTHQIIGVFCGDRSGHGVGRSLGALLKSMNLPPKTLFITDDYKAYSSCFRVGYHYVGKELTQKIESINANIRHYLARFRRKTRYTTKCPRIAYISIFIFTNKNKAISLTD
jgi:insertion element IS1 protein InsB